MKFDFHLHSEWSYDATASVEFYFCEAERRGIGAIAITEHHNMDSLDEVEAAAKRHPNVKWVPGIEFTCNTSIGDVDLVCLGLKGWRDPELAKVLARYRRWQCAYGDAITAELADMGVDFPMTVRTALLKSYRPEKTIDVQGITHVDFLVMLNYLVHRGLIPGKERMKFLNDFLVRPALMKYPDAAEVLPVAKKSGGVLMIAHPSGYFQHNNVKRMDALREELGFEGIECAHPGIPPELTPFYRDYCRKHKLLSSAGTDCHCDPERIFYTVDRSSLVGDLPQADERWLDEIGERLNMKF